jgi:flagellar FliL protein
MSESAPETPADAAAPKKKSKLPLIMGLVLILGGGGFFMMKMKGGAKKPEIKLSKEKAVELKEFLVNLQDKGVYCRTEISLGLAEGVDAKGVEDHEAAIRDAINLRITSKTLAQVDNVAGMIELKHEIATDLNKILEEKKPDADKAADDKKADEDTKADGKSDDKSSDNADAKANEKKKADAKKEPEPPKHPDWDSETGPVLKVYFSSFATQ